MPSRTRLSRLGRTCRPWSSGGGCGSRTTPARRRRPSEPTGTQWSRSRRLGQAQASDHPSRGAQAGERVAARYRARVARTMWADAVRDEVCDLNPWTNLRLETPKGRKDLDALTEQEIRGLADSRRTFTATTGPR